MKKLPFWMPEVGQQERVLIGQVLDSNYLNDGDVTARFERVLAERLGCKHVVAVTSGTAALFLTMVAMGIGPGDEVIVPDVTFIATANAVTMTGARAVLADVDARTLNLSPAAARRAITPRTKAIIPVHVSGRAADLSALQALATEHGLHLIEDAAEAFLSKLDGKCLGTFAEAGCVSFSPNKTITTGQGGAIFTDDDALHVRLRELKDQGRPVRGTGGEDVHVSVGFNFKLTNLQAAVGLGQMEALDARLERMQNLYRWYSRGLDGVREVTLLGFDLARGEVPQWTDAFVERRDELDRFLSDQGVSCRRFWHPIHTQGPYRLSDHGFPNSTRYVPNAIWFPSAFTLVEEDVDRVCTLVRQFYGRAAP